MNHPYSSLSPRQEAVRDTVLRFKQASSSQLRRLHYSGTERSSKVTSSDHFKKLTERGIIRRLPYKLNGYARGSGEFVYQPPKGTARMPFPHTLDITELYVRLSELAGRETLTYDPEPYADKVWGGHKVTPDAYVKVGGYQAFTEIDEGSEAPNVISGKMNRYVDALNGMDGGSFPQVLWLAHSADRVRDLAREAKKKREPELFVCVRFDEAVDYILQQTP